VNNDIELGLKVITLYKTCKNVVIEIAVGGVLNKRH